MGSNLGCPSRAWSPDLYPSCRSRRSSYRNPGWGRYRRDTKSICCTKG